MRSNSVVVEYRVRSLHELIAVLYVTGMSCKCVYEPKLGDGQVDRSSVPVNTHRVQVYRQVTALDQLVLGDRLRQGFNSTQQRHNSGDKMRQTYVLGEIVIGTKTQTGDSIEFAVPCRKENYGYGFGVASQFTAEFETALDFILQGDVHDGEVRQPIPKGFHSLLPVAESSHLIAVAFEGRYVVLPDGRFVFDNRNVLRHGCHNLPHCVGVLPLLRPRNARARLFNRDRAHISGGQTMHAGGLTGRQGQEPEDCREVWRRQPYPNRYPDLGCRLNRARLVILRLREIRWDWLALSLALFCLELPPAGAQIPVACGGDSPQSVCAGSFLVKGSGGGYTEAPRIETAVDVSVSGVAARVSLRQRFGNESAEWIEGIYAFPLPDDAAVDRLTIRVGERLVVGQIRERGEAKKVYRQAKVSGQRAGLVEQERPNLFTTSVANIGPGETLEVEIGYLQTLRFDNGQFSLRLPMTVTPRFIPGGELKPAGSPVDTGFGWARATDQVSDGPRITPAMLPTPGNSGHQVSIRVHIDAGFPLAYVVSPYYPVEVEERGRDYEVTLATGTALMDRDFELVWQPVIGGDSGVAVFSEHVDGENYAMLMFMPPQEDSHVVIPPRELILVIDTSGSMHGESLRQAREALRMALSRLRPIDLFNVIQFNSMTHSVFDESRPASISSVNRARAYVASLNSNGGTNMAPALTRALSAPESSQHLRQVIFVTDGAVGNEGALFGLIHRELGKARLFTIGIGSAPNSFFMSRAAEFGRGTFTFIGQANEVALKMDELFARLESPVLTDIDIAWPGNVGAEVWPEAAPDLYAGQPLVVTARVPAMTGIVTVSGKSGSGHWVRQPALNRGTRHKGVAALWARNKIRSLMNSRSSGDDAAEIRKIVTATALRFGLVSRYTSLVAVDRTPVRPAGARVGSVAVPSLMPLGMRDSFLAGYPKTATRATLNFLIGLVLLAVGMALGSANRLRTA